MNGEAGDDTFLESGVDTEYTVAENRGDDNDVLNGGTNTASGRDLADYSERAATVNLSICMDTSKPTGNSALVTPQCTDSDGAAAEADKLVNVTHVIGGAGADVIKGHTADDILEGGDGADEIYGAAGVDALFGDAGDDHLDGGDDADTFDGDNVTNTNDGDICIIETGETNVNCEL